ncbi:MAG: hypothetical protein JW747_06610, partial [Candidatus Aminicenantes bacterium]|nr:hypothetical protein [Candidatus Aminicenantes bacterium]
MKKCAIFLSLSLIALAIPLARTEAAAETAPLLTIAESSDYKATSTHAEVMAFIEALQARSRNFRVETIARSTEGRDIPLLVLGR